MHSTPRFLQGIFPFEGQGVDKPAPLHEALTYTVPSGITTQPLYFRGGNSTDELITVVLVRNGAPMRYFPVGARDAVHVALSSSRTSTRTASWSCTSPRARAWPGRSWSTWVWWRSEHG